MSEEDDRFMKMAKGYYDELPEQPSPHVDEDTRFTILDGVPIWYYPSMGMSPRFAGELDGTELFMCGGTPCLRLRNLEPAYGEWKAGGRSTTHRTTVPAAAITNLRPRTIRRCNRCLKEMTEREWRASLVTEKSFNRGVCGGFHEPS